MSIALGIIHQLQITDLLRETLLSTIVCSSLPPKNEDRFFDYGFNYIQMTIAFEHGINYFSICHNI